MRRQSPSRPMRHLQHVTQCDALKRGVTLRSSVVRTVCLCCRRGVRGQGGFDPCEARPSGPHRAFAMKISKLNPKSPRGGEGLRSLSSCRPGPPGQRRKLLREIPKSFFWGSRGAHSSAHVRPASAGTTRGGGGLKSLPGRAPGPHRSSCADFFSAPGLLIGQTEIRRNQTRAASRASPCVRAAFRAAMVGAGPAAAQNRGIIFRGHLEQPAALKIVAKFGVGGGSSDAEGLR
jgi:hypothetical protein